jgi:hypothetical protein
MDRIIVDLSKMPSTASRFTPPTEGKVTGSLVATSYLTLDLEEK